MKSIRALPNLLRTGQFLSCWFLFCFSMSTRVMWNWNWKGFFEFLLHSNSVTLRSSYFWDQMNSISSHPPTLSESTIFRQFNVILRVMSELLDWTYFEIAPSLWSLNHRWDLDSSDNQPKSNLLDILPQSSGEFDLESDPEVYPKNSNPEEILGTFVFRCGQKLW